MSVRILTGDARQRLRYLDAESVHCCMTSPPYFGLRDYGVDGQIGLEATPDAYVAELVAVFREVRSVLRDDGTVWLNLGDSYGGPKGNTAMTGGKSDTARGVEMYGGVNTVYGRPKDLIGVPWRVAFALQADGWYLRQDIIWHKPNPMPESVQDRCTKSHEYLFLLSKRERYWYDADAISENASTFERQNTRGLSPKSVAKQALGHISDKTGLVDPYKYETRNRRSVWTIPTEPSSLAHFAMMPSALAELCIKAGCPSGGTVLDPFGGAGTTGLVADRLGRNAILIELNPANAAMADQRLSGDAGMFASVQAERMEATA